MTSELSLLLLLFIFFFKLYVDSETLARECGAWVRIFPEHHSRLLGVDLESIIAIHRQVYRLCVMNYDEVECSDLVLFG